ncbi:MULTISPECIES: DNA polymerase III subunit epsilon [Vibrio]|uniref:DNA polymerase III subunit epsilon n=1 Tax=Vibrio qingdaonensis TaxID=2829491 RepID=A0A9X3CLB4_9VIBR|nr:MULTISPECIES: DNA polymerase III subunit epsilon [Vibrio]MCL9776211.1 DNA polymerase III subunit epsilon [Vibrio methylphosphonaticus]MCW8345415.1 DNA polymerase III subunit epsilon [Vibrio qingdaonensis]
MSKLTAEQRKARDDERFSQRVAERREKGEDVIAYALTTKKAVKFLSKSERKELNRRKLANQEEKQLKEKEELKRIEASFTNDTDAE